MLTYTCLFRHHSDLPKPEFSSENGNKGGIKEGIKDAAHNSAEQQGNAELGGPGVKASKPAIELSRTLNYDCVSPNCNPVSSCGVETKCGSSFDPCVQEVLDKGLFGSEVRVDGIGQIDQNQEAAECDWETLISAADLLTFDSPTDTETLKDPCTDDFPKTQAVGAVGLSEQNESENPSTQPGEAGDLRKVVENQSKFVFTSLENCVAGESSEKVDDEVKICSPFSYGVKIATLFFVTFVNKSWIHVAIHNYSFFFASNLKYIIFFQYLHLGLRCLEQNGSYLSLLFLCKRL